MMSAVANDPRNLARTIRGSPGKATAVDTSTTGLMAGADSRNASAADVGTPWSINRRDTGTAPHSHPGSAIPASPDTPTAAFSLFGSSRFSIAGDTNAAMPPLTSTPSTRNGVAWTNTPRKMVAPACSSGIAPTAPTICSRNTIADTRRNANTCMELMDTRLRSGRSVSNIIDHHARCPPFTGTSQRECSECAEDRSMMWE